MRAGLAGAGRSLLLPGGDADDALRRRRPGDSGGAVSAAGRPGGAGVDRVARRAALHRRSAPGAQRYEIQRHESN